MFDFINTPTTGQQQTGPGGIVYQYDGTKWTSAASATAFAPLQSPAFTGNPTAPTPPQGDASGSVATTAFVAPLTHDVGRNLFHNPIFQIQQRPTSPSWAFSSTTGLRVYGPDRWFVATSGASNGSYQIVFGALNPVKQAVGDDRINFLVQTYNGSTAGSGATDYIIFGQSIENVWRLSGKTVTVSFWASAGNNRTLGVSFDQFFGTGGSPSANVYGPGQSLTIGTGWARYSLTFTIPTCQGQALGTNRGTDYTTMNIWLSAGTSFAARSGSVPVQNTAQFTFWGMQLEYGGTATPLDAPDWGPDFQNCARYFVALYANTRGNAAGAGNIFDSTISYPAQMRIGPTITLITAGASGNATVNGLMNSGTQAMGARFEITSAAIGDCYAINYLYGLSADL